ncbi:hypothetical protein CHUAL_011891 [Chamberlinius hualienensis]
MAATAATTTVNGGGLVGGLDASPSDKSLEDGFKMNESLEVARPYVVNGVGTDCSDLGLPDTENKLADSCCWTEINTDRKNWTTDTCTSLTQAKLVK